MNDLQKLAEIAGTDKATHMYADTYHLLLKHLRDVPVVFMEHGLLSGKSADMWSSWFRHPASQLHFVDIHNYGYEPRDPRIKLHFGSASDSTFMQGVYAKTGPLDCLCDDASHLTSQQIDAFDLGWKHVKPGGIWIVEDCHSVHCRQLTDLPFNIIEFYAKIAVAMQDERGAQGCAAPDPKNPWHSVEEIAMRRGLIIVKKRYQ